MKRVNDYRGIVIQSISVLFILLFVYSAVRQLANFEVFRVRLSQAPLLENSASWLAAAIPTLEIGIALLLLFRVTRRWGLYGFLGLMSLFTAYIVYALNFASSLPCTCNTVFEGMSWTQHLWFNLGFMVLAIVGILLDNRERKLNELFPQPP